MSFQKSIVRAIASVSVLFAVSFAHAEVKIGYVDMQKAIQSTSAGKKAKEQLEKEFKKRKKELAKKEADLKKMSEDLEKKAMVLSDDVRLKKQQSFQEEMLKYREMVGKSQAEIQKKERDLTLPIVKKLQGIIQEVAEKEGYTMILEKAEQSVLWAKSDVDLTDEVIKRFDKKK
jgi:outer membrane protein